MPTSMALWDEGRRTLHGLNEQSAYVLCLNVKAGKYQTICLSTLFRNRKYNVSRAIEVSTLTIFIVL